MSTNNGYSSSRIQRRSEAIDKLLAGRSQEVRLNVLEYMLKYKIEPEDEFFIIFVALGTLETLIENSPKEWQHLFKDFEGDLGQWADANLETLKHLSEKAAITEQLASNSEKLSDSLIEFLKVGEGLISQLQKSNGLVANSLSQLLTSETELKSLIEEMRSELKQKNKVNKLNSIENAISLPPNQNKTSTQTWTWKDSAIYGLITATLLISVYMNLEQTEINQNINQKVQWLLYKANRQECLTGIKKPNSPECKGL